MTFESCTAEVDDLETRLRNALERHPAGKGIAKSENPAISVRYDKPLNLIALSVDGTDDIYLDRDSGFSLMDQIALALEVQAKLGGTA